MARGLADVLDAYLGGPSPGGRGLTLLVPLAPGDRVAAGVAQRIAACLDAPGFRVRVEALDAPARALGSPSREGPAQLRVQLATQAVTRRPDGILSIVASRLGGARASAEWWAADPFPTPTAVVGLGAPEAFGAPGSAAPPAGIWLSAISDREAIRASLGARSHAIESAAKALAGWLTRVARP